MPERKVGPLCARCTAADTCRVLVVDDSALNVKMFIRGAQSQRPNLFEASDTAEEDLPVPRVAMEIAEADDGNSASALVQMAMEESRPFDVVFIDSVMIHMQGPEGAQAMRAMGFSGMIVGGRGFTINKQVRTKSFSSPLISMSWTRCSASLHVV